MSTNTDQAKEGEKRIESVNSAFLVHDIHSEGDVLMKMEEQTTTTTNNDDDAPSQGSRKRPRPWSTTLMMNNNSDSSTYTNNFNNQTKKRKQHPGETLSRSSTYQSQEPLVITPTPVTSAVRDDGSESNSTCCLTNENTTIAAAATTTTTTTTKTTVSLDNNCCRLCSNPLWESIIFYKCGTDICKYFPLSDSNPNPGWYNGTIKMHYVSRNMDDDEEESECIIWNEIHYDDGDIENMTQDELKVLVDQKVVTVSFPKEAAISNLVMQDNSSSHDQKWLETYERLKKFKAENGHCRVPNKHIPDPSLANWVRNQRNFYKKTTLRADRIEKLNGIGFEWILRERHSTKPMPEENLSSLSNVTMDVKIMNEEKWLEKFERLKKYQAVNGHCRVPAVYSLDPSLANWVHQQRGHHKKGTIMPDRREKLNKIGFEWSLYQHDWKPSKTWDEVYERLRKFKVDNGHCRVPKDYGPDSSLGKWVATQRKDYKNDKLSAERIQKLNEIGFDWVLRKRLPAKNTKDGKATRLSWLEVFERLKTFKEETGHCRVPGKYDPDIPLGNWVSNQRYWYRNSTLSAERIEKLNEIGFEWALQPDRNRMPSKGWDDVYERLKKFKEENGHCRVPAKYSPDPSLGNWVQLQRGYHKKGVMASDRIEKLNEIGFDWALREPYSLIDDPDTKTRDDKWQVAYDRLKKFKEENGHCRVPRNKDPSLANWVHTQRTCYKMEKLSADRIEKLNDIGFDWAVVKVAGSAKTTKPVQNDSRASVVDNAPDHGWKELYERLLKFKKENGHCRVPWRHRPDPSLGKWVGIQRKSYKIKQMASQRIEKLNEIGFEWVIRPPNQEWLDVYERLQKFKAENGHCRVPRNYPPDPSLGSWVSNQRYSHNKKTLPSHRIDKLNEIGFDWVVHGYSAWHEVYDKLKKFSTENGHCRVPRKYDPDPPLGNWVTTQRCLYKKKILADDRIEKLNEIGFDWSASPVERTT